MQFLAGAVGKIAKHVEAGQLRLDMDGMVGRDGRVTALVEEMGGGFITAPFHAAHGHHDRAEAALRGSASKLVGLAKVGLDDPKKLEEALVGKDGLLAQAADKAGGVLGLPAVVLQAKSGHYLHALRTYAGSSNVTVNVKISIDVNLGRSSIVSPSLKHFEVISLDATSSEGLAALRDILVDEVLPGLEHTGGLDLDAMVEKRAAAQVVNSTLDSKTLLDAATVDEITKDVKTLPDAIAIAVPKHIQQAVSTANLCLAELPKEKAWCSYLLRANAAIGPDTSQKFVEIINKIQLRHLGTESEVPSGMAAIMARSANEVSIRPGTSAPGLRLVPRLLNVANVKALLPGLGSYVGGMTPEQAYMALLVLLATLSVVSSLCFRLSAAVYLLAQMWDLAGHGLVSNQDSVQFLCRWRQAHVKDKGATFVQVDDAELKALVAETSQLLSAILCPECLMLLTMIISTLCLRMLSVSFGSALLVSLLTCLAALLVIPGFFVQAWMNMLAFFLMLFADCIPKVEGSVLRILAVLLNPSMAAKLVGPVESFHVLASAGGEEAVLLSLTNGKLQLFLVLEDVDVNARLWKICEQKKQMRLLEVLQSNKSLDAEMLEGAELTGCNVELGWQSEDVVKVFALATVQFTYKR